MTYSRYHIPAQPAPNAARHPSRFRVHINRFQLARMLLTESIHYRGNLPVVLSRPCVYGVFSGPVGGFWPRAQYCVGCLRCAVEYPEVVQIHPNPERLHLGDMYFTPEIVDTVMYETSTGRVPVRGAGYRGAFGGEGWDGMWTDMSEIVRPTRDGIHGREFISTQVDIGARPAFLTFDESGRVAGEAPPTFSLPVPFIFDMPPLAAESKALYRGYVKAAEGIQSLAVVPFNRIVDYGMSSPSIVPLVKPSEMSTLDNLFSRLTGKRASMGESPTHPYTPPRAGDGFRMLELDDWDEAAYRALEQKYPQAVICVRLPFTADILNLARQGVRVFHLTANYHGRVGDQFVLDAIRAAHEALVAEGLREQTTLVGGGGIIAAEHLPKAIICGLDAVALDTALIIALQGRFLGECLDHEAAKIKMPSFKPEWAAQRLMNLAASWRDQLLEILGAMGMREVRRLRGEVGRAMFQIETEREAFAGIEGYE